MLQLLVPYLLMIADLSYDEALGNIERSLAKGKALKADVFITHVRARSVRGPSGSSRR